MRAHLPPRRDVRIGFVEVNGKTLDVMPDPEWHRHFDAETRSIQAIETINDVVIDLATKGLVLKDTQATPHYWRLTVSNVGALVITDAGTVKP